VNQRRKFSRSLKVLSSATSGSPSWSRSVAADRFTAASGVCAEDRAGRLVERASAKYERTRSAGNRIRRANRRVGFWGSRNMRALFVARLFSTTSLVTPDGQVNPAFRSVSYGLAECGEPHCEGKIYLAKAQRDIAHFFCAFAPLRLCEEILSS